MGNQTASRVRDQVIRRARRHKLFQPAELVIIGGSLADASGYLTQQVEASVRIYSMSVVTRDTQIRTATLGDRAGLIGACMLARSRRFAEPSK